MEPYLLALPAILAAIALAVSERVATRYRRMYFDQRKRLADVMIVAAEVMGAAQSERDALRAVTDAVEHWAKLPHLTRENHLAELLRLIAQLETLDGFNYDRAGLALMAAAFGNNPGEAGAPSDLPRNSLGVQDGEAKDCEEETHGNPAAFGDWRRIGSDN